LRQDLLHFEQALFGLGHQFAVRELKNQLPVFFFRAHSVSEVTVRFLHLLIVDIGDLQLRFGRFGHVGEEGYKVLVFKLGLSERSCSAFGIPGVTYRQFGARNVFRIRIGIDQGL